MKFHPIADIFPLLEGPDFEALVADIKANGLLQPIELYEEKILDGRNRWKACRAAGVEPKTKEYRGSDPLGHVLSLNLTRRHLSESQRAMVAARIATLKDGQRKTDAIRGQICPPSQDEAASSVNVSPRSVKSARSVMDHGTEELIAAVDRDEIPVSLAAEIARAPAAAQRAAVKGGRVVAKSVARKMKQERGDARRGEKLEKLTAANEKALPEAKRYSVIYADPPWRYDEGTCADPAVRGIEANYPTMSDTEILGLPVSSKIAAEDAILFLWSTSPMLYKAMHVIDAWGFAYKTCMVWVKDKIGMGHFVRQRHELLLFATRGKIPTPATTARNDSVVEAPRGKHSEKPEVFRELIEKMYPGVPKIEMFARGSSEGWETWGREA